MNNTLEALGAAGLSFAVRGSGRPSDGSDLDLCIDEDQLEPMLGVLLGLGAAPIAGLTKGRPHHLSLMVPAATGAGLLDLSIGPLSLGPHIIRDATDIAGDAEGAALTGAGLIVDLLPRRMLAGKVLELHHVEAARVAWWDLSEMARSSLESTLHRDFGHVIANAVTGTLNGGDPPDALESVAGHARRRYLRALLRTAPGRWHLWRTLRNRLSMRPKPFGWPTRGTLVVLVGTDGTGKTTTATKAVDELGRLGVPANLKYFGRTRGNLPGVRAVRDALERRDPATAVLGPRPEPQRWPLIRRAGSWYYAFEYCLRFWFTVFPSLFRGRVVVLDRFVYDLAVMPGGSAAAAKLAIRLVPSPTIVVHLDAPAGQIHARKPERTVEAITSRQDTFARIVAGLTRPTRYTISTAQDAPDMTLYLVAAITMAAHRDHLSSTEKWEEILIPRPDQPRARS